MAYDLIIRGGLVIDGSGAPSRKADVAVSGGRIAAIGRFKGERGRVLDAEGHAVAPGFIDMHTHYDAQLCWDPLATSSSWHGVTTVLTGNCGYGIAPARPRDREYVAALMSVVEGINLEVLKRGVDWEWESFAEYLGRLTHKGLGINVAPQVPHSPLRYHAMGEAAWERPATPEELRRMKEEMHTALRGGAIGFSSLQAEGRLGAWSKPIPSEMAAMDELYELGTTLRGAPAGVITISPRPGTSRISQDYRDFLVRWSRDSGRPVVWSQFMQRADLPDMWKELLQFNQQANAQGAQIYAVAKCQRLDLELTLRKTQMFDYFPTWKDALAKPHEERKRLLADPQVRVRLRAELESASATNPGRRPETMEVKSVALPKNKPFEGRRVVDLAKERGKPYVDFFLDLALEEDLATRFIYAGIMNGDSDAVAEIIRSPYCLPGSSDAGAHLDMDCGVDFSGLLLGHWVREKGVMTLEEGVRRLTSMSAKVLGLADRGLLREGMAADVVVFDPASIAALPREILHDVPGGNPRIVQRAVGVKAVIVNGQPLFEDGRHTGALPGKVLGAMAARS